MLCEKNHTHTQDIGLRESEDGILQMHVCEACRQSPAYPGQKSLLLGRRGSKTQLIQSIAEETGSILEVTNQLPLNVTLYDLDGVAVVRNKEAAFHFNRSPEPPKFKNSTFISSLKDRDMAESILRKVLEGMHYY